jgi:hypothetical protein
VVAHDNDDIPLVADAKKLKSEPLDYSYTERDVILYNLSIGATEKELKWSYESDDDFAALPTYGVIPQFPASGSLSRMTSCQTKTLLSSCTASSILRSRGQSRPAATS